MPWVKRADYERLLSRLAIAEHEAKREKEIAIELEGKNFKLREDNYVLKLSVERLSANNTALQNQLTVMPGRQPFIAPNVIGLDAFTEDQEDVDNIVRDIAKYGRDAVIVREASNERVE